MPTHWVRTGCVGLLIVLIVAGVILSVVRGSTTTNQTPFSDVVSAGRNGKLRSIDASGTSLSVKLIGDDTTYSSRMGIGTDLEKVLADNGVTLGGASPKSVEVRYHQGRAGSAAALFGAAALLGLMMSSSTPAGGRRPLSRRAARRRRSRTSIRLAFTRRHGPSGECVLGWPGYAGRTAADGYLHASRFLPDEARRILTAPRVRERLR